MGPSGPFAHVRRAVLLTVFRFLKLFWHWLAWPCLLWLAAGAAYADGLIHHGPKLEIQIQRGSDRLPIHQVNRLHEGDKLLVKPVLGSLAKGDWVLMLGRISPAGNEVATKAFDLTLLDGVAELEMTASDQVPVILLAPQLRNMFGLYTSFLESELLLKEVIQSDPQRFYDLQKVDQVNQAITTLSQSLDQQVLNRNPEQAVALAKAMAGRFGVHQIDPDCFKGNAVNTQCVAMSMVANKDFVLPTSSDLGVLVGSKGAADLTKFLTDKLGVFSDASDFLSHKFRDQYDFATTFGRPLDGVPQTELFSLARFRNGHVKTAYVYVPAWFKADAPALSADLTRSGCLMDKEFRVQAAGRLPVANYWHSWILEVLQPGSNTPLLEMTDVSFRPEQGLFRFKLPSPWPEPLASLSSVQVQLRGRFGFDAVALPSFSMALPGSGDVRRWLQGESSLVAGEHAQLLLAMPQGHACVQGMTLRMGDGVSVSSTPETPDKLAMDLTNAMPGAVSLSVSMKGAPTQSITLKVLQRRAHVQTVEHADLDEFIQVTGQQLDRIASLQWEGATCEPREIRMLADAAQRLSMACNVDVRSNASLPAMVVLHHMNGEPEPLRMRLQKNAAAPRVALSTAPNALLVRPSPKALQWGLQPQEEFLSDDSGLSVLLQAVDGYAIGKGTYSLQLRFLDDPATARKPIQMMLMTDAARKELRTRQAVRFKGVELPSVVNPLEYRVVHDASGLVSRWMALGRSVLMLPDITALSCAPQAGRLWLHGSQLDLIDRAQFTDGATSGGLDPVILEPCPDGLCLSLLSPARHQTLHVSLGWVNQRIFPVDVGAAGECKAP